MSSPSKAPLELQNLDQLALYSPLVTSVVPPTRANSRATSSKQLNHDSMPDQQVDPLAKFASTMYPAKMHDQAMPVRQMDPLAMSPHQSVIVSQTYFHTSGNPTLPASPPRYAGNPFYNFPQDEATPKAPEADNANKQVTALKKGRLMIAKKELSVLIVGQTGVGKTALLSLIINILEGRNPSSYRVTHDPTNEAGGRKDGSQTNSARLYEFSDKNGVKIRLLDTPGLADTRGTKFDEQHRARIAKTIQDTMTFIDGVLIIANGTTERLQASTDYAISMLSSIFPRSFASNIFLLFTMTPNPMAFNFHVESLPKCLKNAETLTIDNPIALSRKFEEIRGNSNFAKRVESMKQAVEDSHNAALEVLVELFGWLDEREAQPTAAVMNLYDSVKEIDHNIQNALSQMNAAARMRMDLKKMREEMYQSVRAMQIHEKFETVMERTIKTQRDTEHHNTLCSVPQCYSNCDIHCPLSFSLDPKNLARCVAFGGRQELNYCLRCYHPATAHRHYHSIWIDMVVKEVSVDEEGKRKFTVAMHDKIMLQDAMRKIERDISNIEDDIVRIKLHVGELCQAYEDVSLLGSFAGQITKSIRLCEMNLETLQSNGADENTIQAFREDIDTMRQKEAVVMNAPDLVRTYPQVEPSEPDTFLQTEVNSYQPDTFAHWIFQPTTSPKPTAPPASTFDTSSRPITSQYAVSGNSFRPSTALNTTPRPGSTFNSISRPTTSQRAVSVNSFRPSAPLNTTYTPASNFYSISRPTTSQRGVLVKKSRPSAPSNTTSRPASTFNSISRPTTSQRGVLVKSSRPSAPSNTTSRHASTFNSISRPTVLVKSSRSSKLLKPTSRPATLVEPKPTAPSSPPTTFMQRVVSIKRMLSFRKPKTSGILDNM